MSNKLKQKFPLTERHAETSDGSPLVIIDGKPFTWEEVGKMLMAYEGFQIKVKMYDITDDVD